MLLSDADATDSPALTAALLYAANWDDQRHFTTEKLLADPHLAH